VDGAAIAREEPANTGQPPPTYQALVTWLPKTWLLRVGWTKHRAISVYEVPGPEQRARSKR